MSQAHYSETIAAIRATTDVRQAAVQRGIWMGSAFGLGVILGKTPEVIVDEMKPLVLPEKVAALLTDEGYLPEAM
jgi:hypothetical protein